MLSKFCQFQQVPLPKKGFSNSIMYMDEIFMNETEEENQQQINLKLDEIILNE